MTTTSPGIPLNDIADVINHTLPYYMKKGSFEPVFERQNYYVVDDWFAKGRYRVGEGNSIEWRLIFGSNGSAQFVRLFQATPNNAVDLLHTGSAPWVYLEGKAMYEAHLLSMARGEAKIVDYLETQYYAAMKDILDLLESSAFMVPLTATDDLNPLGVPYWVVPVASGSPNYDGGFVGQYPTYGDGSTAANVGGVDPGPEPLWRNWAGTHRGINMETMRLLRQGMALTGFTPPRSLEQYVDKKRSKRRIYTSIQQRIQYADLVNSGPDNRNGDLNPFRSSGSLTFDGAEWVGMAILGEQARNPIYVLDMECFFPFVHTDWWLKKSDAMNSVDRRHVYVVQWDCQFNYACTNRRRQMVLTTDS